LFMDLKIENRTLKISEEVELVYEKRITKFGNSAKIDAPKKYRGWRAYVIIVKDWRRILSHTWWQEKK